MRKFRKSLQHIRRTPKQIEKGNYDKTVNAENKKTSTLLTPQKSYN